MCFLTGIAHYNPISCVFSLAHVFADDTPFSEREKKKKREKNNSAAERAGVRGQNPEQRLCFPRIMSLSVLVFCAHGAKRKGMTAGLIYFCK